MTQQLLDKLDRLSPEKKALLAERLSRTKKQEGTAPAGEIPVLPRLVDAAGVPQAQAFPLSSAQERIWFYENVSPGTPRYNFAVAYRFAGPLQHDALRFAINAIVERHEGLRAVIRYEGEEPVQLIRPALRLSVPLIVPEPATAFRDEALLQQTLKEASETLFDFHEGPLVRAALYRLGEDEHVLLWTTHHILYDGWSSAVFMRELLALYRSAAAGEQAQLPGLTVQYADYASWQRAWERGPEYERQLTYWKRKLAKPLPLLELPTDGERRHMNEQPVFEALEFQLPAGLMKQVRLLAKETGSTLYTTLLAAYTALLHVCTGQNDLLVCSPVTNRTRMETEHVLGFFANSVPLRTVLDPQASFRRLIAQVQETVLEANDHQDVPFNKLVEAIRPDRNPTRTALVETMFLLEQAAQTATVTPGLELTALEGSRLRGGFDLTLTLWDGGEGAFPGTLSYNPALFWESTVCRWHRHFMAILERAVSNPDAPLHDICRLPDEEYRKIVIEWNGGQSPPEHYATNRLKSDAAQASADVTTAAKTSVLATGAEPNAEDEPAADPAPATDSPLAHASAQTPGSALEQASASALAQAPAPAPGSAPARVSASTLDPTTASALNSISASAPATALASGPALVQASVSAPDSASAPAPGSAPASALALTHAPALAQAPAPGSPEAAPVPEPPFRRFERQAELTPEQPAARCGKQALTYRELNAKANRIARYLRDELGVQAETVVGLYLDRSLELVAALLGVMKSGGAYVPLDPKNPGDRIKSVLSEAGVTLLLTEAALAEEMLDLPGVRTVVLDVGSAAEAVERQQPGNPDYPVAPEQLAYVLYTSGSTGKPKGIAVEHRQLAHYIAGILPRLALQPGWQYAMVSTFAADLGSTMLWGAFCTGGTLHVITYEQAADPDAVAAYFRRHPIDCIKLVPSHFEALLGVAEPRDILPRQRLIFAGEASHWETVEAIRKLQPGCTIHNHYGPTETTVSVLTYDVPLHNARPQTATLPLGRPLAGVRTYALNPYGLPVPIGAIGELHIGGPTVTRGYYRQPEQTAERFIADPFSSEPSSRLYRTGDLVRLLADGSFEFVGRADFQVKIRGYRIETGEIEQVLLRHGSVRDAVVIAREDTPGDKRLAAYVVPLDKAAYAPAELRKFLKGKLPDYMVPSALVALDKLPLNANGKLDRAALPAPDPAAVETENVYAAPRCEAEREMAALWADVLGIDAALIGIDHHFFDIGGESLKAIKLVRKLGNGLSVMDLFKHPTIRELSDWLSAKRENDGEWLLHELTRPLPAALKEANLICLPYGGGSAISYQALAQALPTRFSLYAVDLPGHDFSRPDEPLEPLADAIELLIDQIKFLVKGPVILYGHCLGGAAALRLAFALEQEGIELRGVVMAGTFPAARLPGKLFEWWHRLFPRDKMISNKIFRDTLLAFGGLDNGISEAEQNFMLRSLRHDAREAEDYYTALYAMPNCPKLKAPIACIVGGADRMTEFYEEQYLDWADFTDTVHLRVIPEAGHYFQKHQPEELADHLVEQNTIWKRARAGREAPALAITQPSALSAVHNPDAPAAGSSGKASSAATAPLSGTTTVALPYTATVPVPAADATGAPASGTAVAGTYAAVYSAQGSPAQPVVQRIKPSMAAFFVISIGRLVSMLGSNLLGFALGLWVYQATGSVGDFAIISVFAMVPGLLLLPVAGVIADRYDRRKIMIITEALALVTTVFIGTLYWTDSLQLWHLCATAVFASMAGTFMGPASQAAVTQLVPKRYLVQANSFNGITGSISGIMAPVLGGVLVVTIGLSGLLMLDIVSFSFCLAAMLVIRFPNRMFRRAEEPILKEMLGGWHYIMKRKSLIAMVFFFMITNFFMTLFNVLVTPFVMKFSSADVLGIIYSGWGVGALVGSVLISIWGGFTRRATGMVGSVVLVGLSVAVVGLLQSPVLAFIGMTGFGFALAVLETHWQSIIQTKVGLELQGRVFATNMMLAFIMRPLSFVVAGPLADRWFAPFMSGSSPLARLLQPLFGSGAGSGIGFLISSIGIILLIWGFAGLRYRPLRYMEDILPDAIPGAVIVKDKDKLQKQADQRLQSAASPAQAEQGQRSLSA
ncbi:amino acid adenylation domain-containing protein [Paenibacillus athensensis]|uniref:Uncharacterized protein n=1 Tax=Paenibacillus athensensis TaxID=1967502 RepID=A0A4Y8Q929_9BACL|nr:non-ribosomal peptide synthetase [Paenibacillus athensensis]MCD1258911.1 amino acid adenylation domain-containing protein [Paenibacillus athensensis]